MIETVIDARIPAKAFMGEHGATQWLFVCGKVVFVLRVRDLQQWFELNMLVDASCKTWRIIHYQCSLLCLRSQALRL